MASNGAWIDTVDSRPETSPYIANSWTLRSNDNRNFIIPHPLLAKHSRLQPVAVYHTHTDIDASHEVTHVLVHYMFTNTYQCLRPKGANSDDKQAEEFSTAVRVYAVAQQYEIPGLESLAKSEIDRLQKTLHFSVVLGLVQSLYPASRADDPWISSFLKPSLTSLLRNPWDAVAASETHGTSRKDANNVLLTSLRMLAQDKVIVLRDDAAEPAVEPLPDTKDSLASWTAVDEVQSVQEVSPVLVANEITLVPDVQPPVNETEDPWGFGKLSKKDKKKKKKKAQIPSSPPSDPVPESAIEPPSEPLFPGIE